MTYRAAFVLTISALFSASGLADNAARAPASTALFVAQHLDVLSIPSSIYARRRPGANTLAAYGFDRFRMVDGGVQSIDQDEGWIFGIKIVADESGIKVLCVQDQPLTDHTYLGQTTIEVKIGQDGLFHGTGRYPINAKCPPYQP